MKKMTIFFSIVSLVLVVMSFAMLSISYGWFAHLYTIPDGQVGVGDIEFNPTGSFITDLSIIEPQEELVDTTFSVVNESSITTQLRIQIVYTKITNDGGTITSADQIYHADLTDHLSVTMDSNFVVSGDYFYYGGETSIIAVNSGLIDLITSIYYDGDFTGIDYQTYPVEITITIQAKQASNVTWNDLATYDFSTGQPA